MTSFTRLDPLEPAAAWTARDLGDESSWTVQFTTAELNELDAAMRHALALQGDILDVGPAQFPLRATAATLADVGHELIDRRGFVRLRGIDRAAYSQAEMEMLYWGIGVHLGTPWEQNQHGHVLGDVTDQGASPDSPTSRGNEIGGLALPLHSDGSDLVGLLCLANGRQGGRSVVANVVAIHNRLVLEQPDVAAVLYQPFPYDYRGEEAPGRQPWYSIPVFTRWSAADGTERLFVRCIPSYIDSSQRHASAPRLRAEQREALRILIDMAESAEYQVEMDLLPGDMQFINNYHVLHGRTAYDDDRTSGQVRHLKRLWLSSPQLADRPRWFATPHAHWASKRSTSKLAGSKLADS